MNNITRRSALRAIGLSAPAANMAAGILTRDMMSNPGIANVGAPNATPSVDEVPPKVFNSFSNWLREVGHDAIKEEARWISGFDGDIVEMHLPLATKVRMQRVRNIERLLDARKNWFTKTLRRGGEVKWWD